MILYQIDIAYLEWGRGTDHSPAGGTVDNYPQQLALASGDKGVVEGGAQTGAAETLQ